MMYLFVLDLIENNAHIKHIAITRLTDTKHSL